MRKFTRHKWNHADLHVLRAVYVTTRCPDAVELSSLAQLLQTDIKNIRIWFQNARQRKFVPNSSDIGNAMYLC